MNAYHAYRRQEPSAGWTRIDMLLALFDKAIERLDKAEACLNAGERPAALGLLAKAQLVVSALASGVRLEDGNDETGANLLRLYEYVTNEIREANLAGIANARTILTTLREGFEAIRPQANQMEKAGEFARASQLCMVHASA